MSIEPSTRRDDLIQTIVADACTDVATCRDVLMQAIQSDEFVAEFQLFYARGLTHREFDQKTHDAGRIMLLSFENHVLSYAEGQAA